MYVFVYACHRKSFNWKFPRWDDLLQMRLNRFNNMMMILLSDYHLFNWIIDVCAFFSSTYSFDFPPILLIFHCVFFNFLLYQISHTHKKAILVSTNLNGIPLNKTPFWAVSFWAMC